MLAERPNKLSYVREEPVPRRRARPWRWIGEGLAVAAIVLMALLLRTYNLATVPLGLHGDEAITGLESARILREGNIGPYSLDALGQPTGPFYLIAVAVRLLGPTILAVRIVPALLGTLTVLALFFVIRRTYGPTVALAGTALLATQGWHLHFSRIGFPLASWPLVTVLAAGALVEALRQNDWRWWGLTGLLLGLGVYCYNAHLFFIAIAALFVAPAVSVRCWRAGGLRGVARCVAPVLVLPIVLGLVALPLLQYAADPRNGYSNHARAVSVTNLATWRELDDLGLRVGFLIGRYGEYWYQACCRTKVDGVDGSGTVPLLPPPLLALAVAGAVIGCCQRRGRPLALFGVCVALLLPQVRRADAGWRGAAYLRAGTVRGVVRGTGAHLAVGASAGVPGRGARANDLPADPGAGGGGDRGHPGAGGDRRLFRAFRAVVGGALDLRGGDGGCLALSRHPAP